MVSYILRYSGRLGYLGVETLDGTLAVQGSACDGATAKVKERIVKNEWKAKKELSSQVVINNLT